MAFNTDTDAAIIGKLLDHAEQHGFREFSGDPSVFIYTVDIRGTITHCKLTCSIMVDFHDVHAYHADGRDVTYCEGNVDVLQMHLDMCNDQGAVADWAKKNMSAWA